MLKLYAIEFTSNLSVEIHGEKRKNFKKGDRVVITRDDRLKLLRLGCSALAEKEVEVNDIFDKEDLKWIPEITGLRPSRVPVSIPLTEKEAKAKAEAEKEKEEVAETVVEETETEETVETTEEAEEETPESSEVETDVPDVETAIPDVETAPVVPKKNNKGGKKNK